MELFQSHIGILKELGFNLEPNSVIVDLGCGDGKLVHDYRQLGYEAFGCDFEFKKGEHVDYMRGAGIIRLIESAPYHLPFEDGSVDFLVSNQVLEHVRDYSATLSEIKRVLKPGGMSLHIFPSRYTPIEPHLFVPFGTVLQKKWWLMLWAVLGIRNQYQKELSVRETLADNSGYLKNHTNYLTKEEIRTHCKKYFTDVRFCEDDFLKYSRRGRIIYLLSRALPFLPALYSTLRSRVLFLRV